MNTQQYTWHNLAHSYSCWIIFTEIVSVFNLYGMSVNTASVRWEKN
jgi:hypothetical protein